LGDSEIGEVARAFDALLGRTQAFIEREQAFTRDVSHELRTPLAVMRLSIERLRADSVASSPVQHQLAALHAATLLMEQTVATLLLLAREDGAQPVADAANPVNPAKPVAASFAAPVAEPTALLPLVEQWVLAHAGWLEQQSLTLDIQLQRQDRLRLPAPVLQLAISSLLGNAFAHGAPGGQVQLAFEGGALRISNPGPALPPQAGSDFGKGEHSTGYGLGLAILQRLLESRGGRLRLSHADGITTAAVDD